MADAKEVARVIATPAAVELIEKLRAEHGECCFISPADAATAARR